MNERIAELDKKLDELFHLYVNRRTYDIFGLMCNSSTYDIKCQIEDMIRERADEIFLSGSEENKP